MPWSGLFSDSRGIRYNEMHGYFAVLTFCMSHITFFIFHTRVYNCRVVYMWQHMFMNSISKPRISLEYADRTRTWFWGDYLTLCTNISIHTRTSASNFKMQSPHTCWDSVYDPVYEHVLWNYYQVNATEPHCWWTNTGSGNGVLPSRR